MVRRVGTSRTKSRKVLKKPHNQKGKLSLSRYFAEFKAGDRVVIKIDSAVQKGTCHIRFHGRSGAVNEKRGNCYDIEIKDGSKKKTLCLHPAHLKKI